MRGSFVVCAFLVASAAIFTATSQDSETPRTGLAVAYIRVSSGVNSSHLILDGDPSSYWSSEPRPGPGRQEWIKIQLGSHAEMVELRLKPSPRGGFPSGFKVFYSTDHGEVWYPVGGANYNSFPDPGLEEVIVALHGVVGDALMIQASYLRRDLDGGYTFQLAEAKVIGHEQFGPFRTSRGDQWDADLNNMWRVFGLASDGTQAVPAMGGESAWLPRGLSGMR